MYRREGISKIAHITGTVYNVRILWITNVVRSWGVFIEHFITKDVFQNLVRSWRFVGFCSFCCYCTHIKYTVYM